MRLFPSKAGRDDANPISVGSSLTGRAARAFDSAGQNPPGGASPRQLAWRQLKKNKLALIGLYLLFFQYFIAIFGQFFAPFSYQEQTPQGINASFHPPMNIRVRDAKTGALSLPFVYGTTFQDGDWLPDRTKKLPLRFFIHGTPYKLWQVIPTDLHFVGAINGPVFLLGTDEFGRDYLSRMIYGAMISLSIGFIGISITFVLGMLVGGIAGFYGGAVDDWIMRLCEVMMSVPDFYLLLALAAALPDDLSPLAKYLLITAILSFVGWAGMARIIRGMVLSVREREYVEAGRALGLSDLQLIKRHILPSTFTYAIIAATMSVPAYILAESGLALLGLGLRDPMASWGNMLAAAQNLTTLTTRPWILAPGVAIFITTISFNFLGDGLRDALDPKSRKLG
ncbi:peptide/nickel transport system permease protein [Abditibacterium utsteinense]|uniref:Peptide/nickel transport system permease protein n=1 Tax=Abditibacterium utsteinense TaxID=1960156 RepID=A0A2S8ST08_9BACT|nr:ABC transporter permease [Abditibacterium utsteinense]PQV63927.1 peptide/nickel transport system permease protein [Abditibacterium utsteinense]